MSVGALAHRDRSTRELLRAGRRGAGRFALHTNQRTWRRTVGGIFPRSAVGRCPADEIDPRGTAALRQLFARGVQKTEDPACSGQPAYGLPCVVRYALVQFGFARCSSGPPRHWPKKTRSARPRRLSNALLDRLIFGWSGLRPGAPPTPRPGRGEHLEGMSDGDRRVVCRRRSGGLRQRGPRARESRRGPKGRDRYGGRDGFIPDAKTCPGPPVLGRIRSPS